MLSAKADVTGRAKQRVAETTEHIAEKAAEARDAAVSKAHHAFAHDSRDESSPPIGAFIGAAAVLVVGLLVWRRRHRR
jgi:MYXO-CTERM domain-containing protein